ncbi:MAG TPA: DUF3891 family protein [Candidatus Acidoferrum sp.]|nr:DUF3891 family protein [Candidatus Acidoferrum sp.]
MLRLETENGWWLVTHPDHARLAGAFAERWGNERFLPPEPRARVLKGIARHDDGWAARDAAPQITRQGKPSAFSVELVGNYSAFEEIDLADYLAVRDRAVRLIAEEDAYAAVLILMHTYNLLSEHADRSTIAPQGLPLLDQFLGQQKAFQQSLLQRIAADSNLPGEQKTEAAILEHFHLLQATDNLSLLTCVDFSRPANLLHPLPLRDGGHARVEVRSAGSRHFVLDPYPFAERSLSFTFPARRVLGKTFASATELQGRFAAAPVEMLSVTVSAA